MANVQYKDYSIQCEEKINDSIVSWLYEAGGELKSTVQRNSRVDTGQTKGSWECNVDETNRVATVGSHLENAIWEEFGTGIYAVNGDGRKTPWVYTDRKGKTHFTRGKKPTRNLQKSYESLKDKMIKRLEQLLKGLG